MSTQTDKPVPQPSTSSSSIRPTKSRASTGAIDRETRLFTREPERSKAGYVRASENSRSFDDPGIFIELPLVNQIRPRVKAWREADYPGATGITKRLLQHWRDTEQRDTNRRFFFCQLEAIETLIWLTEAPPPSESASTFRAMAGRSPGSAARWQPAPARRSSWPC